MEAVFRVVLGLLFYAEWLDIVRQRLDYGKTAVGVFFCLFAAGGVHVERHRLFPVEHLVDPFCAAVFAVNGPRNRLFVQ